MSRTPRRSDARGSERWLRAVVNDKHDLLNRRIASKFRWDRPESITWLSPLRDDHFAEYSDQDFLDRLGLNNLRYPLSSFWPSRGPHWDGLARTATGKVILVEAKAYIEESVDFTTHAKSPSSIQRIERSLAMAKQGFGARKEAPWNTPFYQTPNRLAHLFFLHKLNRVDAWMLFIDFANAPDVDNPCTVEEWRGAIRLTNRCLGLGFDVLKRRVAHLIWDWKESPLSANGRKACLHDRRNLRRA